MLLETLRVCICVLQAANRGNRHFPPTEQLKGRSLLQHRMVSHSEAAQLSSLQSWNTSRSESNAFGHVQQHCHISATALTEAIIRRRESFQSFLSISTKKGSLQLFLLVKANQEFLNKDQQSERMDGHKSAISEEDKGKKSVLFYAEEQHGFLSGQAST